MAETDSFETQLLAQMRDDFLAESQEILDRLEPLLVQLEKSGDPDLIQAAFRDVHTLKGTAGFVGLVSIQQLAHKLEDVFGALRDGRLSISPELMDAVFAGVRSLADMREDVSRGGMGERDIAPLLAFLDAALQGSAPNEGRVRSPAPTEDNPPWSPDDGQVATDTGRMSPTPTEDDPPWSPDEGRVRSPAPTTESARRGDPPWSPGEEQVRSPALTEDDPPWSPGDGQVATDTGRMSPAPTTSTRMESTLRVDVEILDAMMELVGELVTARNALLATAERLQDELLIDQAAALNRLTRELQTAITSVRLVPVERLFARFSGVVRSMARECGKQVRLAIEGGETPLDRTISEQIYDPLVHLLRNAIDHGLESTVARAQAGKPQEGTIRLCAERRGDDVILRVADDGRGIDLHRVRQVAVERGVCSAEEATALSDEQAAHLIFAPGFSTATEVTDLSGRGVGLDVVVGNVHRLRGSVSVETELGRGTTFVIQLPLALAILQVQLVRVNGFPYALPMHIVRETLRIARDAVQTIQQGEVTLIRGAALPVRRLRDWLPWKTHVGATLRGRPTMGGYGAPPLHGRPTTGGHGAPPLHGRPTMGGHGAPPLHGRPAMDGPEPAIVVRRMGRHEVWIVDELIGKQQVVIKPLGPYLGTVRGIEGAAILPDGSVTLVLDVEALID
jgi:two-component system chemotaxis sensor kinase CheA